MNSNAAPQVRRQNERRIVACLLNGSPLSRAELAHLTGLSAPTVGKIADRLLERGVLEEMEPGSRTGTNRSGKSSSLGRPSRPLALESHVPRFVTVEIGVRKTQLAVHPVAGPRSEGWLAEFGTPNNPSRWKTRLAKAAKTLGDAELWGVAVSVPGVCDEREGRILLSPNLHWTERVSLPELVQAVWDRPVILVQEIRALALGHLRAQPSIQDFLHVDFGDGLGAAIVRNGELYDGPLALSGELGHTPVLGNRRQCGCGAKGCVETLVARSWLPRTYAEQRSGRQAKWSEMIAHIEGHGLEPWLEQALESVAIVIAGAMNVTGVTHAVLTGTVTSLPAAAVDFLTASVESSAMWARFGDVSIVTAPRRRAAGLVTAALERQLLPLEEIEIRSPLPPCRERTVLRRTGARQERVFPS